MRLLSTLAVAFAAVVGSLTSSASAWSFKEHIQFTRLAVQRIIDDPAAPADLKAWLKEQTPLLGSMNAERDFFLHTAVGAKPDPAKLSGLTWWVCVPDIAANDRGSRQPSPPSGLHERLNHFIDLEFFNPAGPMRTYQKDLSSLPAIDAIPRDVTEETYKRAGYLPLAREHAYRQLVDAIRAGRLVPDRANPEDQDHAVRWAGYLVHYTQDNTQPHHATMDYKSAQYFPDPKSAPNVHAEMEYRMADDAEQPFDELRAEFWPLFVEQLGSVRDEVGDEDVFLATLKVAMESYRSLPLIGEAAVAAADLTDPKKPTVRTEMFFRHVGMMDGREQTVMQMKARQTAWAVVRTENVLRQAWAEAKR